jgi:ribosome-binding factor A
LSQRIAKAQELTREVLGESIQRLKDPRVGFTTVTAVRMTPDLQQARVFVSVLGTAEDKEQTMAGLASAAPHLRTELGQQVRLRYTPELIFDLDRGADTAKRIDELLRKIHAEEAQEAAAEGVEE